MRRRGKTMEDIQFEMIDILIADKISSLLSELSDAPVEDIAAGKEQIQKTLRNVNEYHELRNDFREVVWG